jgi:DNA-directed RNA polymerase subunit N (RpoN/RPB10)
MMVRFNYFCRCGYPVSAYKAKEFPVKITSAEKQDTIDDSGRHRHICRRHGGIEIEYYTYYQFGECPLCTNGKHY